MVSRRTLRRLLYANLWRLRFLTIRPWRDITYPVLIVTIICAISSAVPPSRIAAPGSTAGVVTVSTDRPSEAAVTAYHSTATGAEPKSIRLPSINTDGFVQKVGVDQHQQVAVPTNIHLAGWFVDTVTPGDPGLSIIDGHLDGYRQPGIFAGLAKLKPGSAFEVTLANNTIRRFRVKTVQSLPTAQVAAALFSQTPGITRQLNLITCGGNFNKTVGAYDHRVIVTAEYLPAT